MQCNAMQIQLQLQLNKLININNYHASFATLSVGRGYRTTHHSTILNTHNAPSHQTWSLIYFGGKNYIGFSNQELAWPGNGRKQII
jgi:hypothetical protein